MSGRKTATAAERRKQQKKRQPLRGNMRSKKRDRNLLLLGSVLILIGVAVTIFLVVGRLNQSSPTASGSGTPVDMTTLRQLTGVSPALLSQIGVGKATNTFQMTQNSPAPLTGPTGKPDLLYV
jgi:hypothetical protein